MQSAHAVAAYNHPTPVLLLTHDAALWQHWRQLDDSRWLPARGESLQDLQRWTGRGNTAVLLDSSLPRLPDWNDPSWEERLQNLNVLVASSRPSDDEATQVLAIGASGYLHAYSPVPVLARALDTISNGGIWMGRTLMARMLRDINQRLPQQGDWARNLTARERRVAQLAALGESNQAIGDALGISERTVRAHLSAVFEKLQVSDRLMLALRVHGIH